MPRLPIAVFASITFCLLALAEIFSAAADTPRRSGDALKNMRAGSASGSSAEAWARNATEVMTDRNFYRKFPKDRSAYRFSSLVGKAQFDEEAAVLEGRDASRGVLYLYSNLALQRRNGGMAWVSDIQFAMPRKDASGREVYPLVVALFEKRLRPPTWVHTTYARRYGLSHFWRKGTSRYVLHLDLVDFEAYGFNEPPGSGPWVIVGGGEEQGEDEGDH